MSETNNPGNSKNYRSKEKIESELKQYGEPSLQLRYIESAIQKIEDGRIEVERNTREMLQDLAVVIWYEASPEVKKRSQTRMEYILQSAREFEESIGESKKVAVYKEHLSSVVGKLHRKENSSQNGLVSKVAVYAGFASALIFFSASSITGNVISESSNTIASRSIASIGIGILVVAAFAFFSRKR